MPLFEYRCSDCGKRFEDLQVGPCQEEKVKCPSCGSENVEKQVSSFATSSENHSGCGGGGRGRIKGFS